MSTEFAIGIVLAVFLAALIGTFLGRSGLLPVSTRYNVPPGHVGLLYHGGELRAELPPGLHRRFGWGERFELTNIAVVQRISAPLEFQPMTSDQFSFRLRLAPVYQISEPAMFYEQHGQFGPRGFAGDLDPDLHTPLASVVLERMNGMTLDDFLYKPTKLTDGLAEQVSAKLDGMDVTDILLTSVSLPPEVRKMNTEVERAKREGQARLERSRAETASLRSLANAARSLDDNPALVHLRTLQTMESSGGSKTFILGDPDLAKGASTKSG